MKKLIRTSFFLSSILFFIGCSNDIKDVEFSQNLDQIIMNSKTWNKQNIKELKDEIFIKGTIFCFYSITDQIEINESNKKKKIIIKNQNLFNNYSYLLGYISNINKTIVDIKTIHEIATKKAELLPNQSIDKDLIINKCIEFVNEAYNTSNLPNTYDLALNNFLRLRPEYFNKKYDILIISNLQNDFRFQFNKGRSDAQSDKTPNINDHLIK